MSKTKAIIVVGFMVAFGAGLVGGMATRHTVVEPRRDRGWLTHQLNLTADQEKKMHQIWSDVVRAAGQHDEERRRAIRKDRDEAITNLIGPENWIIYDKIMQSYDEKMAQLAQERGNVFHRADTETKKILDVDQLKKFEEIIKKREAEGHGRGPGRRNEDRATSRPAFD